MSAYLNALREEGSRETLLQEVERQWNKTLEQADEITRLRDELAVAEARAVEAEHGRRDAEIAAQCYGDQVDDLQRQLAAAREAVNACFILENEGGGWPRTPSCKEVLAAFDAALAGEKP